MRCPATATASSRARRCRRSPAGTCAMAERMHIETTLRIEPDHPAFAGHFPGHPVVPGVWLLDAVIHAWQQMPASNEAAVRIDAAKFLSPVGPGEVLTISLDVTGDG